MENQRTLTIAKLSGPSNWSPDSSDNLHSDINLKLPLVINEMKLQSKMNKLIETIVLQCKHLAIPCTIRY